MAGKLVKKRPTLIIDKVLMSSPILPLARSRKRKRELGKLKPNQSSFANSVNYQKTLKPLPIDLDFHLPVKYRGETFCGGKRLDDH